MPIGFRRGTDRIYCDVDAMAPAGVKNVRYTVEILDDGTVLGRSGKAISLADLKLDSIRLLAGHSPGSVYAVWVDRLNCWVGFYTQEVLEDGMGPPSEHVSDPLRIGWTAPLASASTQDGLVVREVRLCARMRVEYATAV